MRALDLRADPAWLAIEGPAWVDELAVGSSVAVNGVCLTVVAVSDGAFRVEVVPETLRRTNLGDLAIGRRVNLERAARIGDRLDGHLVSGHVDAVGQLLSMDREGEARWLTIAAPEAVMRYVVPKGSIAVDGMSLTVAARAEDRFQVTIIPHTWRVTNLCERKPGDRVNLEADIIGKYVERLVQPYTRAGAGGLGLDQATDRR